MSNLNTPKYVITLPQAMGILPAGSSVVERSHAAKFLGLDVGAELSLLEAGDYRPLREADLRAGQTALFVRPGGFGDLLFITPTLRALKAQGVRVQLSTIGKFADAVRHDPAIDEILPYPVSLEAFRAADAHVWLERILEDGEETKTTPAVEMIAQAAGVTLEDFHMRYVVTDAERKWAAAMYPKVGKRVGVQAQASAINRTYPIEQLNQVTNTMAAKGWQVMLFGEPGSIEAEEPFVNLTKGEGRTFRESCAVVETCDIMITPDSSLCHVAAALNIPTVALFGPFPSAIRVSHEPSVWPIDGKAPCAPCHHHDNTGVPWPKGCPGWKTGRCAALANITPQQIVKTALLLHAGARAQMPKKS